MHILFLSQWFTPEPTIKGMAFVKALANRGNQVHVLTGFPNYPGGRLYPGYRLKPYADTTVEDIRITRVFLYPSHDRNRFGRVINYLSFAASATVAGILLGAKVDLLYAYHPPATIALPTMLIAKWRDIPFLYDVQDLWPDTLRATGMIRSQLVLNLIGIWCKFTYKRANKIAVLSNGFKRELVKRGVPSDKVAVIPNWCDESLVNVQDVEPAPKAQFGLDGKFVLVFAGTMGKAQRLDRVLEAADMIEGVLPDVHFVFVGGGIEVETLKGLRTRYGLDNVTFLPPRPMSEIGPILRMADALLVQLEKDPLFDITIPSKLQTYLAVGRPLLAGLSGDAADVVEAAKAGFCYEPASPGALVAAVKLLHAMGPEEREMMGASGRRYYLDHLSMERGVDQFCALFEEVCDQRSSRTQSDLGLDR